MSVGQLSVLAMRELLRGVGRVVGYEAGHAAVEGVAGFFNSRLNDPSQKAILALKRSTERSWRAIEISLAGESLLSRLDRAEDKAFREQVRHFLAALSAELPNQGTDFQRRALADLRHARKQGLLLAGQPGDQEITTLVGFARFTEPAQALSAEWEVLNVLGDQIRRAGYEDLGKLVLMRISDGSSLLAVAVRFFFRQEVSADPQLFHGVVIERTDALAQRLDDAFQNLGTLLEEQGERLESLLESLQAVVVQTHAAVLDLHAELQQQGDEARHQFDTLYQSIQMLQSRLDLGQRELRPRDSLSIRNDGERQAVKQLVAQYRALPAERRGSMPALLNAIGKLEVAAGSFEEACQDFDTVARMVGTDSARGEAHFNAYRAALEAGQLDRSLAELRHAVDCDPRRFAPFSLDKYEPVRILGAGGFGVTFHCHYRATGSDVAVKVLTPDGLERDIRTVFQEAGALDSIQHPAIIRLRECDFADAARSRPYLVMEYFEGQTLQELVEKGGPLPGSVVLPVFVRIAEAMQAAHARGVLHRDIKPANLLVKPGRASNEPWQVKIIDFGLALKQNLLAEAGTTSRQGKTVLGSSIAGTIDYAAPEQLGKIPGARIGPPADVYGFGRTCCFALFGTPNPLRAHWRQLSDALADILESCLHENPGQRLQDFDQLVQRLTALHKPEVPTAELAEVVESAEMYRPLALGLYLGSLVDTCGNQRGCYEILACTARLMAPARLALSQPTRDRLALLLDRCRSRSDHAQQAAVMRKGFEDLLAGQSMADLLRLPPKNGDSLELVRCYIDLAIEIGAPAYNAGDQRGCYEAYAAVGRMIVDSVPEERFANEQLRFALKKSAREPEPETQAWTMRHAFDAITGAGPPVPTTPTVRDTVDAFRPKKERRAERDDHYRRGASSRDDERSDEPRRPAPGERGRLPRYASAILATVYIASLFGVGYVLNMDPNRRAPDDAVQGLGEWMGTLLGIMCVGLIGAPCGAVIRSYRGWAFILVSSIGTAALLLGASQWAERPLTWGFSDFLIITGFFTIFAYMIALPIKFFLWLGAMSARSSH